MKNALAFAFAFALGAGWLLAADSPVVGNWDCVAATPDGTEMRFTLMVEQQEGKLAGKAVGPNGDMPLVEPKLDGDVFTFKVVMDSESYSVSLKVSGEKMDGTWNGGGESGSIKGLKKT